MGPRRPVDRERIRRFLSELGRRFHQAARVYLVGGTTVVFENLREQTLDIDLVLEVDPKHHGALLRAIRQLKDELSTNVEEASPGDFIPLPDGHENRHVFVERFGKLDVFHFDPYSSALSKVERGLEQDYDDVLALLRSGVVSWDRLEQCFKDILPRIGTKSLRQDPVKFEANFRTLEAMRTSAT
jgi:hypothetical protein